MKTTCKTCFIASRTPAVALDNGLSSLIAKQEPSMPESLQTCQLFFRTRPAHERYRPLHRSSSSLQNLSGNGTSGKLFARLGRLGIIAAGVIIFVSLSLSAARAQVNQPDMQFPAGPAGMNQPGMQFPSGPSAQFDRKESVLDRFRAHTAKKNQAARDGLFMRWDAVFHQEPTVILSDGKSQAHITLRLPARTGEPPKFSVSKGHCVSAKMTDRGVWILVILPTRGTLTTSVTVDFGGSMTEYPLSVAPPLHLFDRQNADAVVIDYVTTANQLATSRTNPPRN